MAEKRMFAQQIIDSDAFLDMPLSTQALYFHLAMRADDDGFINNPKRIQRMLGCSDDDLKLLMAKSFVLAFDSGVIVIKHWRIHNTLRHDRYKPTAYQEELAMLTIKENKAYTFGIPSGNQLATSGIPNGNQMDIDGFQMVAELETQIRLDKIRLDKDRTTTAQEIDLSTGCDADVPMVNANLLNDIVRQKWNREPTNNDLIMALEQLKRLNYQVDMLEDALDIAAQHGARAMNWNYTTAIIDGWLQKGYKTEEDVLMHELNRKGGAR